MEVTSLWITHIVQDAFPVAEEVFAMDRGRIVQTGSPEAVYCQPAHESVARISGIYSAFTKEVWECLRLDAQMPFPSGAKRIGLRPEWLQLVEDVDGPIDGGALCRHFFGAFSVYSLRVSDSERVWLCSDAQVCSGERYAVTLRGKPFTIE
jgi:putative spermidine/putrescine transport system ATP-binding protein